MSTSTEATLTNIKALLQTPVIKQLVFLLGIAGGVTLGIILYMSIQEPLYRPLDYQVTPQNMASIVDTLDKAGIRYKMNEQDGIIQIPAKDIQLARLKLSSAGIAKDDGFNFSFLNEQGGIGTSQFLENARYLRALENDLSKTVAAIEGVASARVHIAIPHNNIFADENGKPTASVVVNMAPGISTDKEKVRAIVQIIASSVPGLDPKNVAITDQYGHYLSGILSQDSLYNADQLAFQNNIQSYYEKRIESMITTLLGDNKVNVRVYADIDYSQQEEAKEQYDPNQQVLRSEQSVSEQSGSSGASGPPGSLSNTPPQSDAEKNPGNGGNNNNNANGNGNGNGSGTSASSAGTSQGKNESIKNYELGKSVSYKRSNNPKVKNLSVAVVVDNEMVLDPKTKKYVTKPMDKEKIAKITELVRATIGFDEKRGDKVTVVNSSFSTSKKEEGLISQSHLWEQPWFWDLAKKLLGMLFGFSFLYLLYRRLSSYIRSTPQPAPVKLIGYDDDENDKALTPEIQGVKQEKINRLKELANREPQRVASVIKNWVGK